MLASTKIHDRSEANRVEVALPTRICRLASPICLVTASSHIRAVTSAHNCFCIDSSSVRQVLLNCRTTDSLPLRETRFARR